MLNSVLFNKLTNSVFKTLYNYIDNTSKYCGHSEICEGNVVLFLVTPGPISDMTLQVQKCQEQHVVIIQT